jgi:uncharacterized membrane protein HdeD (DUF308 family)
MNKGLQVWWAYLVQGTLLVLLGWVLLAKPVGTLVSLVLFLGFYLLVSGITETVMSFFGIGKEGSEWGWELLSGLFMIIAGLIVLNNALFTTVLSTVAFAYIVALGFVIDGIVKMVSGKRVADNAAGKNFVWTWGAFFLGLLNLVFGLYLLVGPTAYTVAKVWVATGWFAIIIGAVSVVMAFVVRGEVKKA